VRLRKAKELSISEKTIETSILAFLSLHQDKVMCFKVENGGVFDQKRGAFRFNKSTRTLGIPDILGIFKGLPLAIEVKSQKGRLSEHQAQFLSKWAKHGGIAFVARSIDDVKRELKL
jgi:penicillin-binding protein-related factor A (putative recombinase)